MNEERILREDLEIKDPIELALLYGFCNELMKVFEKQDSSSAIRWGVFNTIPLPGGLIVNGAYPLGEMVGGMAIFCKLKESNSGVVISIFAGRDLKLRVSLLVARLNGVKTDISKLQAIERKPATVCSLEDLTTTIDKLMNEFKETLHAPT